MINADDNTIVENSNAHKSFGESAWWQSSWAYLISLILTVLSITLAFYFYIASRVEKKPVYTAESTSLISRSELGVPGLKVSYGRRSINQLTSTTIRFWNAGSQTIDKGDIAASDMLRIPIPRGSAVLSSVINKTSRRTVEARTDVAERSLYLRFAFLDKNDGMEIKVLHTGTTSSPWRVIGTLKGAPAVAPANNNISAWLLLISGIISLAILPLSVRVYALIPEKIKNLINKADWDGILVLIPSAVLFYLLSILLRSLFTTQIPASLR